MDPIFVFIPATLALLFLTLWLYVRAQNQSRQISSDLGKEIISLHKAADVTLSKVRQLEEAAEAAKAQEREQERQAKLNLINLSSIRTALRYNGIPDGDIAVISNKEGILRFTWDERNYRIIATNLPCLAINMVFNLDEPKENLPLVQQAATEVTDRMFIGKAAIIDEGSGISFSAEMRCDSYLYFRDSLLWYLDILNWTSYHFQEILHGLKEQKKQQQDAAMSGSHYTPDSLPKNNVQS